MGWHLRSIIEQCFEYGCTRNATERLYNPFNAPSGAYCSRHAARALKNAKEKYGD